MRKDNSGADSKTIMAVVDGSTSYSHEAHKNSQVCFRT